MKILVVGRSGQVARALALRHAVFDGTIETLGRPDHDLERPSEVSAAIANRRPDVVVNAAAFTAVDTAETEQARAFAINAAGAEAVARGATQCGAVVIQLSTDYVFPGDTASAYLEGDATGPRSVYGASKLEAEQLVQAANQRAIILRTSWVFDAQGSNFVRTMLRLARTRSPITVVGDQWGCPTFADDLAAAVLAIAADVPEIQRFGTYHCAGAGETNWAAFAAEIFALSKARGGPSAEVTPILTRDYPTAAARPANSRLNCAKLAAEYGVTLRPWQAALAACIDEIAADGWRLE